MDALKMYQPYINNYNHALETFSKLNKENPEWVKFLKAAEAKCTWRELFNYLIQPVQRIPRYGILMKEIQKSTPTLHPDAANVKKAIEKIEALTEYLNEKKAKAEQLNKMLALENCFYNLRESIVKAGRNFIKEGSFFADSKKGSKYIFLFLFDDVLLITRQKTKSQYKVKEIIYLVKVQHVEEVNDGVKDDDEGGTQLLPYTSERGILMIV
jgi:hypothetical protein